jgi:hypothetical protein
MKITCFLAPVHAVASAFFLLDLCDKCHYFYVMGHLALVRQAELAVFLKLA